MESLHFHIFLTSCCIREYQIGEICSLIAKTILVSKEVQHSCKFLLRLKSNKESNPCVKV